MNKNVGSIFSVSVLSFNFMLASAWGNPLGGVVGSGAASITSAGNTLIIGQSSGASIINWSGFNIAAGETTWFQFPSAGAASLNLVTAGNPSTIAGMLKSTVGSGGPVGGTVLLLNPSGVLFTPTARVSVGSLVATTLGLADQTEFLNGQTLHFSGGSSAGVQVQNGANLSALGDIFLIAHTVQNAGTLAAGNEVGLAAGATVTLLQPAAPGAERLQVEAGSGAGTPVGVDNTAAGRITAVTAELQAAGGNIYALAINNGGAIRANTVVNEGGHIYLRASGGAVLNTGTLDASGATGGEVEVAGGQVTLGAASRVDVSGATGGGTALIGGGWHGADPAVPNAQQTTVAPGATINASAVQSGNGGTVAVWSDNATTFGGQIFARGGAAGGNGGRAEVSGENLLVTGHADLTAAHGGAGTLLLDPGTVTIDHSGTSGGAQHNTFGDSWIGTQLGGGNLIISTANSTDGGAEDLTVNGTADLGGAAAISWNSANSLTLIGNNSISLHAGSSIANAGTGGLTLTSGGAVTLAGSINLPGAVVLNNGGLASGGGITAGTLTLQGGGNVGASGAGNALNTAVTTLTDNKSGGDAYVSQTGALNVDGATTGAGSLNVSGNAGIQIDAALNLHNGAEAGDTLAVNANGAIAVNQNVTAASVDLESGLAAGDAITFGVGPVVVAAAAQKYAANGAAADVNFANALLEKSAGTPPDSFEWDQGADIPAPPAPTLFGGGGVPGAYTLDSLFGNVTIPAGDGGLLANSALTLKAPGGSVIIDDDLSLASLNVSGTAIQLNGAGGAETITTTGGDQNYSAPVTLGAATTLNSGTIELAGVTAGANNLTLNNSGLAQLNGAVTGTGTLTANGAGTLRVNNNITEGNVSDSEATTLNGTGGTETVTTTGGDQNYTAPVTLGAATTLNSGTIELAGVTGGANNLTLNNSGLAQLNGAVNGTGTLTANGVGTLQVNNNITAGNVSDSEATTLNGTGGAETVTTTGGDQNYTAQVTLGAPTTLNSGTIELAGVTAGANNLTLNNSGLAKLNGAVNGTGTLTANGAGTLQVNNNITEGNLSDSEATTLNGTGGTETVTAAGGDQNYTAPVTLGAATTLNSGTVELAGGVAFNANPLVENNSGQATFGGTFSDFELLTFNGSMNLGANTILDGTTFSLPAVTGNGFNLTLGNSGLAQLNGAVNGTGTLTANGAGTLQVNNNITEGNVSDSEATTLNGTGGAETVTTTGGDQSYSAQVTLGAPTTLNSGTIELAGVTAGANNLTLNNSGLAKLNGAVTGTGTLTANGAGTLQVNNNITEGNVSDSEATTLNGTGGAETVTTAGGDQNYTAPVTLGAATTLNSGTIELAGVTAGANNLTLNNGGLAQLNGAVTGTGTLTANGAGTLRVNNNITEGNVSDSEATTLNGTGGTETVTTIGGDQNYTAQVTLGAPTTLNSGTIELAGVTAGANNLTLNNGGLAQLNGAVTGTGTLTANGAGTLQVNNNITEGNVSDSEATTLNGTGGAETVTTTGGDQSYSAQVTLGAATTLNSGTIELAGVTGGANNLTLNNGGLAQLNGAVNGTGTLTANGAGTLRVNNNITEGNMSDSEATALNGTGGTETVTTTGGDQSYSAQVTLGAATTLNSGTIELAGVTAGANNLTLNNSGLAQLNGAVNGTGTLTANGAGILQVNNNISEGNVSDSEATALNGTGGTETVTTAGGDQNYTAQVTLGAPTTLNSGTIELAGVTAGANNLTLNNSGLAKLNGAVTGTGTLTANGAGTLQVNNNITEGNVSDSEATALNGTGGGETVTTTGGDQNYTAQVMLGAPTTLNSGTIELAGVAGGANNLTLNNSGLAQLNGAVNGTGTLTANGAGTLQVNNNITEGNVSDSEATALNGTGGGETVTTTGGDQNYTAQVTLGAPTTLNSGTIELAGVTAGANNLTLNNGGLAMLNGAVTGTGTLTANGAGTLQVNNNITEGNVSDSEATALNGTGGTETVTTAGGDQNYTAQVTLGAATTLNSGTIELAGVTGGANNLTLNNSGLAQLNGAVTGTGTLTANGAGTLRVNNNITEGNVSDSEATALNGTGGTETVTTAGGDQNYTAQVTLGAATTLNSGTIELAGVTAGANNLTLNNSGLATLGGAVTGTGTLTANGAGTLQVNNNITEGNVSDSEATALNGTGGAETVTTAGGDQNYTGQVTLGAPTTLNSGTIELAGVTGGANNLTLNNGGLAKLNGAVTGTGTLTASGAGSLQVNNNVTAGNVSDSEATTLNGTGGTETVTTAGGDQNYTAPVTLGAATTLNSGTVELVGGVVFNANTLTLNNSGQATFGGTFTDFGLLTFNGSMNLGANTILDGTAYSLPAVTGNAFNLTLGNSGLAKLNGAVTGTGTLTANGAGTLQVNNNITEGNVSDSEATTLNGTGGGETVTTTGGDQNYTAPVTLGAPTTLNSGTIELAGVAGGANNLTLNNSGLAQLNGAVTGTGTLTANGAGTLRVNNNITEGNVSDSEATALNGTGGGETVTTTGGDQNYTAQVTLGAPTTLNSGTLELAGVTAGANNLTLNNSGLAMLNGAVTGTGTLTANGAGTLRVNNNITEGNVSDSEATALNGAGGTETVTTAGGDQNYTAQVTLGAATTLNSGTIELAGVTGGANNLTLNNSGLAQLNGAVTGTGTLTANGAGTLRVNNNITEGNVNDSEATALNGTGGTETVTTAGGDQNYTAQVTLGAATTLNSGTIELAGVTAGANNLTLNNGGLATLGGAVTGTGTLTANGAGTLQVNNNITEGNVSDSEATALNGTGGAETVTTAGGDQNYTGQVTLGAPTTLNSGTIELAGVTGGANNLTLNNGGLAKLNGAVTGTGTLTASGGGTLQVNNNVTAGNVSDSEATTLNGTGGTETVTTAGGDQNYTAPVTLDAATTLNSETIELVGVTGGANSLTLKNSGLAKLNGAVNGTGTLSANGAGTLQVNNNVTEGNVSDGEVTALNGTGGSESVTTTGGDQSYTAQVTLGAPTTLNSGTMELAGVTAGANNLTLNNSGLAKLNGAMTGTGTLTASAAGSLQVNNNITEGNVSDSEATAFNGTGGSEAVTTTGGDQNYTASVTLGAATTLNSGTIELAGVTAGANNLTLNNSGLAKLGGAVTGAGTLAASGAGTLQVNNNVSEGSVNDSEATTLNGTSGGEAIQTSGGQTYNAAVVQNVNTHLTGGSLAVGGGWNAQGHDLQLTFGSSVRVPGFANVDNFTSDGAGGTTINGAFTTSGNQTYNNVVTLGAGSSLQGVNLTFGSSINGGGQNLTLNNSGVATLGSGGASGLGLLTIGTSGGGGGGTMLVQGSIQGNSLADWEPTTFNVPSSTLTSPTVATTGEQVYNGPITLNADTYLAGSQLPTVNNSVNANGYSFILELLTGNRFFDSNLAADEDERRILGSIAPHIKKGQVKIITPFPGKRVIKEPGYLKGSSDVPLDTGTEVYSLYSTLVD